MGQGIGRVPEAPAVAGVAAGGRESGREPGREPIGRYIAQQRRLRGIDLEDIAARTRIPRRSLERLEAGAFDGSPDGFSRGFVRTVAEAIGLDPDDAVARMLPEPDATRRGMPRSRRALGVIAAAIALAALALGLRELASRLPARPQRAATGLPLRHDYVRELAEQHGVETAKLTARSAVLPPLPPEPIVEDAEASVAAAAEPTAPAASSAAPRPAASAAASPAKTKPPASAPAPPEPRPEIATAPATAAASAPTPEPEAPPVADHSIESAAPPPAAPPASAEDSTAAAPEPVAPATERTDGTAPSETPEAAATTPPPAPPEPARPEPVPLSDAEADD